MSDTVTLYATTETQEEALAIARRLVEERLVACANILPRGRSVYRRRSGGQGGGAAERAAQLRSALRCRLALERGGEGLLRLGRRRDSRSDMIWTRYYFTVPAKHL